MTDHDPARLSIALNTAVANGDWNPTGWGRTLLANLDSALRLPRGDDDQETYRGALAAVFASDLLIHVRSEIADGLLDADLLAMAVVERRAGPEAAPELPTLPLAA